MKHWWKKLTEVYGDYAGENPKVPPQVAMRSNAILKSLENTEIEVNGEPMELANIHAVGKNIVFEFRCISEEVSHEVSIKVKE